MDYEPENENTIELLSWDYVLPDPAEELMQKDLVRVVQRCLDGLTPRESKVIAMRFGLDRGKDYTLEQIGTMFGVTKDRIRQIEAKALRKLAKPSFVAILNGVGSKTPTQINEDIRRVNEDKRMREELKRPPKLWQMEWVRRWDRKDPDEMVEARATPNGWINGSKFHPMIAGLYERKAKNFTAYCKWNGKSWLVGRLDKNEANQIDNDRLSGHQNLDWRKI
jgi:hypothetical protein